MKHMKLIMTLVVCFAVITVSFGQKKGKMKNKVEISELKEELNLTEEQTHKVLEARAASNAKMKVLRADEKLTKEEKRSVAKEIRQEHMEVMDEVLTTEQKEQSKSMHKEKRAGHKKARKEKREEISAYRAEFDQQISAEDKVEIKRIRTILRDEKGKTRGERPSREDKLKFKEAHKAEFDSLDKLSKKYKGEIQSFMESKGVQHDRMKVSNSETKEKGQRRAKGKKEGKKMGQRKRKGNNAARFLLMGEKQ